MPCEVAITEWPEYVWAMRNMGKSHLQRFWPMPDALIGQPVALHCGVYCCNQKRFNAICGVFEHFIDLAAKSGWTTVGIRQVARKSKKEADADFQCNFAHQQRGFIEIRRSKIESTGRQIVAIIWFGKSYLGHTGTWSRPNMYTWPIHRIEWIDGPVIQTRHVHKRLWNMSRPEYDAVNLCITPVIYQLYQIDELNVSVRTLRHWRRSSVGNQRPTIAYGWQEDGGGDALLVVDRVFVRFEESTSEWDANNGIVDAFARNGRRAKLHQESTK